MCYVITKDNKVLWRGNLACTCQRLAPILGGVACMEVFGSFFPLNAEMWESPQM